jgi:hypothetical protein
VTLAGFRADVKDCFQAFDLFVSASRREPFGRVIIEALDGGAPVIATAAKGPRDIARRYPIELVGNGNVEELAVALSRAYDRPRERVEVDLSEFHIEHVAARMLDAYRDVLGARQPRGASPCRFEPVSESGEDASAPRQSWRRSPHRRAQRRRNLPRTPTAPGRYRQRACREKALELLDVAAGRRRVARHFGRIGEKETEHSADVIRRQRLYWQSGPRRAGPSTRRFGGARESLVEIGQLELAQGREPGGHRDRISRQRAGLVHGSQRRDVLHDLAATAETHPPACRRRRSCRAS